MTFGEGFLPPLYRAKTIVGRFVTRLHTNMTKESAFGTLFRDAQKQNLVRAFRQSLRNINSLMICV